MSNVMEFGTPIRVGNASADPSSGSPGEIYYNTTSGQIKFYNGSSWSTVGAVISVNSQTGAVTLTTDNISEGVTNLYFTTGRAQAAAVVNSLGGSQTNQAPSVASVNGALATYAALASPALTGTPTAPTATAGTNTTQIATTAFVTAAVSGSGAVTSISVASANGFAGSSSGGTTPALTISTSVTGILYGNGTSIAAAVAGNFPTLNQNTTGTAANITATTNSTLTTLSSLSLPFSQLSGQATLAQLPSIATNTILGNNTVSTATPTALTGAQVTALLSTFSTSTTTQGAVPGSNGATTSFLRGDGSWAIPSGTGVTSITIASSNGFAGSSSGGSTPALTISTTITGILKGNGTAISAATAGTDYVVPSGSITGTASNITATTNSTLTTLSALSLPGSQVTGNISGNAANVTGVVAIANGGTNSSTTLTNNKVMVSTSGAIVESSTTTTQLSYLDATSSIQTQLNGKQATGNYITALTGDVTASGPGSVAATIAANAVTNAKLAQMPTLTIKGNNTGGTANASDLTVAQVNAILPVFTSTLNGLTPSSGGGTTNFLRADGTWATPTGSGSITSISIASSNGFTGSSSGGTTPTLTIATSITGILKGNGTAISAATAGTDYVIPSGSITGTAANITATTNSTLTTLSALSLPATQLSGTLAATQFPALTGQVTTTAGSLSTTIATNTVTNSNLAQMAANSIKGNNTGSIANAADLTATQVTAMLNQFTSTLQGLVPASGGGTTNYLRADGTWAAAGGGASTTITATAGQTLNTNDAVYIASSSDTGRTAGQAYQVDATNDQRIEFVGFVQTGVSSGSTVTIVTGGPLTGFTGLTTGKPIFASTTTPGSYQTSAPTTASQWMVQLGTTSSTSAILINGAGSSTAIKIIANTGPSGTVYNTNTITANYSATSTDNVIFIGGLSSAITVTLPAPSNGKVIIVEDKSGAVNSTNTVTITHNSGETINGASSVVLNVAYGAIELISDGTNWAANIGFVGSLSGDVTGGRTSTALTGIGQLVTDTVQGDQFKLSQDTSYYRTGSWSTTTSGAIYTLVGDLVMQYWSHNTAINSSGNFLGVDDPGPAQLWVFTEGGLEKTYTCPTTTTGQVPGVAFPWVLTRVFDTTTGNVTFNGTATVNGSQLAGLGINYAVSRGFALP